MVTRTRRRAERAELTVSSKRQITIPAAMARELGIRAGDRLVARVDDGSIVLDLRPRNWLDYISGSAHGLYGRTREEVDACVREVREGWDDRARTAEGDAYIPEDVSRSDR